MATFFKNKVVKEIGKVNVPIYEVNPSARATVIGLSLANLTESVVSAVHRLQMILHRLLHQRRIDSINASF